MSGVIAEADNPKAVLLAIHGGGTSAVYFDCPGHPELSLLRLGATLGFTVVAIDRPGHGSSAAYPEAVQTPSSASISPTARSTGSWASGPAVPGCSCWAIRVGVNWPPGWPPTRATTAAPACWAWNSVAPAGATTTPPNRS